MSQLTLDIWRVKKYCREVQNIDIENPGKLFRINDDLTFSLWNFNFGEPDIQQLRIDYSDEVIKSEIALQQLRAYRNKFLTRSDKFVTVDYPLSIEIKSQIVSWRQELRDLPQIIDPELLTIDETGRFDKSNIPPPPEAILRNISSP